MTIQLFKKYLISVLTTNNFDKSDLVDLARAINKIFKFPKLSNTLTMLTKIYDEHMKEAAVNKTANAIIQKVKELNAINELREFKDFKIDIL